MLNALLPIPRLIVLSLALLGPAAGFARAAGDETMLPDAFLYPGERPGHILVVDKVNQMLYLYQHDGAGRIILDRVMPCSTGENLGDKMVEGDRKTPNGFYIFNQKLLPRELAPIYGTLAYPTDYPNFWDRRLGRGGYGIWLHGINKPLTDYDSNGCIELENADIARLEDLLRLFDTPLITYENLILAPVEDLRREGLEIKAFLEDWRRAWSSKNQTAYREKYAPEFINSDGRSFEDWMTHKENVAKNYRDIKVEIKDLRVYRHRDVITAAFEQDYRGDQRFTSVGLKRLYLKKAEGGYKIIGEEFTARPGFDPSKKLTSEEKRLALVTPPLSAAPATAEPEGRRAAVEARAAAEDRETLAGGREPTVPNEEGSPAEPSEQAELDGQREARLKAEADARAKAEAEARAKAEADARAKAEAEARLLTGLVENWAAAWAGQEVEAYFAFYHPDFRYRAKNMDLAAFKAYRAELMNEAEDIEVKVSDFEIQVKGDLARVIFRQDYRSDQLLDRGRKTLILKKTGPDWKILSETWQAD
ncbi:MAG: L,D-transpeptidase family protein [Candidatus Adiutrix sp.]|jgi:murein L,D-transpeptidase YafK|nr:L,D-transpeptidase family protein [Candidatus Adiutrix sp.]